LTSESQRAFFREKKVEATNEEKRRNDLKVRGFMKNTNEKQCFEQVFERAKKIDPDETFFVDRLFCLFCPFRS